MLVNRAVASLWGAWWGPFEGRPEESPGQGMSLIYFGLFAGRYCDIPPLRLLKSSANFVTHPSAWCREERCVIHQKHQKAEQRQPICVRETVQKQNRFSCNRSSELRVKEENVYQVLQNARRVWEGTRRHMLPKLFQRIEVRGPKQPHSIALDKTHL